jgi:hypothetical protein
MDILEDASLKGQCDKPKGGAQPLFDKNKALDINEVAENYKNVDGINHENAYVK